MSGRFRRKTNHDWWKRLDEAAQRHTVSWHWTRGHDGHLIQEAADRAARKIASEGAVSEDILRDAMAVDSLDSCGIYFGTTGGQVYGSADGGDTWAPIVRDLPAVVSVEVQTLQ